jgi:excisionase family DNA binding protein
LEKEAEFAVRHLDARARINGPIADDIPILTLTLPQAVRASGWSRSKLYELISSGDLPACKLGARTYIRLEDLKAFVASLPNATEVGAIRKTSR